MADATKTPKAKLTERRIADFPAKDKDTYHWDTEVKGFGVKVTPAGNRSFVINDEAQVIS